MFTYEEPSLVDLLLLTSFLSLLQLGRTIASKLVGAGLLGECAVGIIFGSVANILPIAWEQTFLVLGYVGLLVLLVHGGLELKPALFLPNLPLSTASALVGIGLPVGFTFALFSSPAFDLAQTSSFAAGAALASTSLGTTFYVLDNVSKQEGLDLASTTAGTLLQGVALVDDVIALSLLAVLDSLGEGDSGVSRGHLAWIIVRPLIASAVMAVAGPAVALFVLRPFWHKWAEPRVARLESSSQDFVLLSIVVLALCALVTISTYIHTTVLFGAFLSGALLSLLPSDNSSVNFLHTFERLVLPVQSYLLAPLFFASIGYSIPFLSLWTGEIIWKGIVYAILMTLGKMLVGGVLVAVDLCSAAPMQSPLTATVSSLDMSFASTAAELTSAPATDELKPSTGKRTPTSIWDRLMNCHTRVGMDSVKAGCFLGSGLVARGEIGLLVLQATRSAEHPLLDEKAYLIAIWAVALCTIVGPIGESVIAKRWGSQIAKGAWGLTQPPAPEV